MINLADITDEAFKTRITSEADAIVKRAAQKCADVLEILETGSDETKRIIPRLAEH
jgi:formiminotetrahydrofolate cyclodeaminase